MVRDTREDRKSDMKKSVMREKILVRNRSSKLAFFL